METEHTKKSNYPMEAIRTDGLGNVKKKKKEKNNLLRRN